MSNTRSIQADHLWGEIATRPIAPAQEAQGLATVRLTEQLIACESLTPHDAGCMDIIAQRLSALGFSCTWLDSGPPTHRVRNLWAYRPASLATHMPQDNAEYADVAINNRANQILPKTFAFAGHTDVVPTGPLDSWQSNPFAPTHRDEKLFGRGASDMKTSLFEAAENLEKMQLQLREIETQAESQMQDRIAQAKDTDGTFDPLEFDRYTRVQELARMMAESLNDVATIQRTTRRMAQYAEDDLNAQAHQTRELQRDILRTRMVQFEGLAERLYRVVRQAAKDADKQVKLDIVGGKIEMDRSVLDRMTSTFEHLLRNGVAHGIEPASVRAAAGKSATGEIVITLQQEGNDVSIEFRDDGAGLNLNLIRDIATERGLIEKDADLADEKAINLIFMPGFSTADHLTELSGRGIGLDVVRAEVLALGGHIETTTQQGHGTCFKIVLPLTTAVTHVVTVRSGDLSIGIPANLIDVVRRVSISELKQAYQDGSYLYDGEALPFFWVGALLAHSAASKEAPAKTSPIIVVRSAAQRVALHVDDVLGTQEVVVKNLGPQLSRLPGLAGMTVLASGAIMLIYNPVALARVYGDQAHAMGLPTAHAEQESSAKENAASGQPPKRTSLTPLVLVVDDSITVRRVTQRLLTREGYRVTVATDGVQALQLLEQELPDVILSDIEMPRMDGFELLKNVRTNSALKHLPMIMISSRIAEKHRDHAFELGANHYLGKPYSEETLLSLIYRYANQTANA